ncbi:hypothetical protein K3495_g10176 [Podosphaera aphanis]|nr:hypothetical protein K3495_g10176 [Podosphaera aphanis]
MPTPDLTPASSLASLRRWNTIWTHNTRDIWWKDHAPTS